MCINCVLNKNVCTSMISITSYITVFSPQIPTGALTLDPAER